MQSSPPRLSYIEIEKNGYKVHEIREIEFPHYEIWSYQTMSFPCSRDGKGRSRLILIDPGLEKIMGIYLGGGTKTHDFITPLSDEISDKIKEKVPWEKYK